MSFCDRCWEKVDGNSTYKNYAGCSYYIFAYLFTLFVFFLLHWWDKYSCSFAQNTQHTKTDTDTFTGKYCKDKRSSVNIVKIKEVFLSLLEVLYDMI